MGTIEKDAAASSTNEAISEFFEEMRVWKCKFCVKPVVFRFDAPVARILDHIMSVHLHMPHMASFKHSAKMLKIVRKNILSENLLNVKFIFQKIFTKTLFFSIKFRFFKI